MPARKHSSTAFETDDALYFFDAGEGCSYTAHNMGIDLLKTKNIVISHTHLDHVGGFFNLLWTVRKLRYHSFFYSWDKEIINHEPVFLEVHGSVNYQKSIDAFDKLSDL